MILQLSNSTLTTEQYTSQHIPAVYQQFTSEMSDLTVWNPSGYKDVGNSNTAQDVITAW